MVVSNPNTCALLTDMYQVTMAYAYFKGGRHEEQSCFELFFRTNPFKGQYTLYCGLHEALEMVASFRFTEEDISYLKDVMPNCDREFFIWLGSIDCSDIKIYSIAEGTVVFPREPLLRVEGPLGIAQLLETPLLNAINFPSLVATNASRFRNAVGPSVGLLEFGLRRAQGPDGGLTASRYSYIGGFNGTSNLLAGKLFGITVKGTHAHSFVQAYRSVDEIKDRNLNGTDLVGLALGHRERLNYTHSNEGELAAFCAYAIAFPDGFTALVDTYDTLQSGLLNFIAVSLALDDVGHRAVGLRIDSGDLAYLSKKIRSVVKSVGEKENRPWLGTITIVASNDISEEVLHSLHRQGHSCDVFGVGTNLVTCLGQPALGGVYKLVSINDMARIKLSENKTKVTIPCKKAVYRLYGEDGLPLLDYMSEASHPPPVAGTAVLCRHPFDGTKRVLVRPSRVVPLHSLVWPKTEPSPTADQLRERVMKNLSEVREDVSRVLNPTPYRVSLSGELFSFFQALWEKEATLHFES